MEISLVNLFVDTHYWGSKGRRGLANFPPRTSSATGEGIGHVHVGVVLLLRPQSFSFFLSYLNFVIPARFTYNKRRNLHKKAKP